MTANDRNFCLAPACVPHIIRRKNFPIKLILAIVGERSLWTLRRERHIEPRLAMTRKQLKERKGPETCVDIKRKSPSCHFWEDLTRVSIGRPCRCRRNILLLKGISPLSQNFIPPLLVRPPDSKEVCMELSNSMHEIKVVPSFRRHITCPVQRG